MFMLYRLDSHASADHHITRALVMPICRQPDWKMARWNRMPAYLVAVRVAQLKPPADSPKMVTLSGSPPKAAMLSWWMEFVGVGWFGLMWLGRYAYIHTCTHAHSRSTTL